MSVVAQGMLQEGAGDVQGVNDSGNVTKDGQQDVDEEVSTAAALEEDTKRREDDGDDDLDDVARKKVSTRRRSCSLSPSGRQEPQKERERREEATHDPVKGILAVLD